MKGIKSYDASIVAAKTSAVKDHLSDFNAATSFSSGLSISNIHSGAQLEYANRHSGKKRYVSAVDSSSGRGGRGRARRGGGRFGQQSGRGNGHGGRSGRGGHGRGDQRVRMNNVDVTDPNRNFQADEWEKLGSGGRAYVLQLRDTPAGGRGGRDGGRGGGAGRSVDGQRSASAASTATNANNTETGTQRGNSDQSVVSEITERGSQNGRNFGRGAY